MTEPDTPDTPDTGKTSTDLVVVDPVNGPPRRWEEREWPLPWMGAFLAALSALPNAQAASQQAGVSRSWAYECADTYPEFKQAWEEAREDAIERLERHVHQWGTVGIEMVSTTTRRGRNGELIEETVQTSNNIHPSLAMFVLKRYRPEYRERYGVEHTGKDGGPINITVEERLSEAVDGFDAAVVRLAVASEPDEATG